MTEYYRITMEDYERYLYKIKNTPKPKSKKALKKEQKTKAIINHNGGLRKKARGYAKDMRNEPSPLEKKMIEFLDYHNIRYEFQKIFYIKGKNKRINRFFIADFYIPSKNTILETDGKFHDNQKEYDDERTASIKKHYPNIQVIRWRFNDFRSPMKMKKLLEQVA